MKPNYYLKSAVTNAWINHILSLKPSTVYQIEGALNDAYLIDFSGLRYGRVKRQWLIVVPEYANTWGDNLHAMLTDDDRLADQFISEAERQQDSWNEATGEYDYNPVLAGKFMKTFDQLNEEAWTKFIA